MYKMMVSLLKTAYDVLELLVKAFKRAIMLGSKNPLYTGTAVAGLILRTLLFSFLSDSILESFGLSAPFILSLIVGFVINVFLEAPLRGFTFMQVGIFYTRGNNPVLGSSMYTLFYFMNCGLLFLALSFYKAVWFWIAFSCYATTCYIGSGIVLLIKRINRYK